ncbi:nitroreductase family protein [Desulfovibrio sp. OttesenSCG-928-C06]|nr:nitroreductase family protein [Desulfovibrio sp. OttesenSCG-928-C06]
MNRRKFIGASAAIAALALKDSVLPSHVVAARTEPDFIPMPEIDASGPIDPQAFAPDSTPAADRYLLPTPNRFGGGSLVQALAMRRSTRAFVNRSISTNILSDLLWSTWGINRQDGRRTAPTARNNQNAEVYVALSDGIWLYNAGRNQLERKSRQDIREKTGPAPVILLYAAPDDSDGAMTVGSLYQNAGLYCASAGLGNVVRSSKLGAAQNALQIQDEYKIWVSQSIGWPS